MLKHLKNIRVVQIAPPASLVRYSRLFAKTLGLSERIRAAMQWRLKQNIGVRCLLTLISRCLDGYYRALH